jgi:type IV pilus assembly protein PilP
MRLILATLTAMTLTPTLKAQTAAGRQPVAGLQAAPVTAPEAVDAYVYKPDGRRDPFLSLLNTGSDPQTGKKSEGIANFSLGEISVRGIVQSRASLVAMVQGPDNKTYLVHQGDKLADAVVKSVTTQGLLVMQDVSDPLSIQKQREVRKLLRSLEGANE